MKVVNPSFEILGDVDGMQILKNIELAGRVCYKSENKITNESAIEFVKSIIKRGHEAVIEHEKLTFRIICDRGVSHEIVRHRLASYCQESTRYCNYSLDKFDNNITFVKPVFYKMDSEEYLIWEETCEETEKAYNKLLSMGSTPQEARSVLPNSLKTEIVTTMDLRELRHFFMLRTAPVAHPSMREVAIPGLKACQKLIPVIFDDIEVDE